MKNLAASYLKVDYNLRPAKQIERRMILDTFHNLGTVGFPIRDYKYVGFGSIYFVDFVMFHKLLGIRKLLSIEADARITKRVEFNRPFEPISIEMKRASEVIPEFDNDQKYILWLDYDNRIDEEIVSDVALASYHLSSGSFFLITVDIRPPENGDNPMEWMKYYDEQVGRFLDYDLTIENFNKSNLAKTNSKILFNAISSGPTARNVRFMPLFSFEYADSCPMLRVGGVVGGSHENRMLDACDFSKSSFVMRQKEDEPYKIRVPRLTPKERLYLDGYMPCQDKWKPKDFELKIEDVQSYREIYRYYPSYAELLL